MLPTRLQRLSFQVGVGSREIHRHIPYTRFARAPGMNVNQSERFPTFPSEELRPDGSLENGTPAKAKRSCYDVIEMVVSYSSA